MSSAGSRVRAQRMTSYALGAAALTSLLVAVGCWTFVSFSRLPLDPSPAESLSWSINQAAYSGYASQSATLALILCLSFMASYPLSGRSLAVRGGWRLAFALSYSSLVLCILSYGLLFAGNAGPLRWPATAIFLLAQHTAGRVESPAPLFIHEDAIYGAIGLAAFATSMMLFRSFWRTTQFISAALTLLPVLIFAFDRKEFQLHFAEALVPVGLGWFTNEYLLFAGIGAAAMSTVFRFLSTRERPRLNVKKRNIGPI